MKATRVLLIFFLFLSTIAARLHSAGKFPKAPLHHRAPCTVSGVLREVFIPTIDEWGPEHAKLAQSRIQGKFAAAENKIAGATLAADSDPRGEYRYFWVRDNGIVVREMKDDPKIIHDYLAFSKQNHINTTKLKDGVELMPDGPGEPKFNPDGTLFTGPWGRPQRDSAAYRAARWLDEIERQLQAGNLEEAARHYLIDVNAPSVNRDLDYLARTWSKHSTDLWEEEEAMHLHTVVMAEHALDRGSRIAARLEKAFSNQPDALARLHAQVKLYSEQAQAIRDYVNQGAWDESLGHFRSIFKDTHSGGLIKKEIPLDISILIAGLHANDAGFQSVLKLTDDRMMATVTKIEERSSSAFHFNERFQGPENRGAAALFRYDGDIYHGGNPWVVSTHAGAEYYYRLGSEILNDSTLAITERNLAFYERLLPELKGKLKVGTSLSSDPALRDQVVKACREKGDAYLNIVQSVTPPDGYHAEQIGRGYRPGDTGAWVQPYLERTANAGDATVGRPGGEWQGAVNLTWNDASFLTAWKSRQALLQKISK